MRNSSSRDATIDIAKGIAIIAIVFGHVWRGLYNGGIIGDEHTYVAVDRLVYLWHLSVFALLAGLFVERGMRREGKWRYAVQRDVGFLWLYVLWTLIQGALEVAASSVSNSPERWSDALKVWLPTTQLWFLGWLAIMLVITALLAPWVDRYRAASFVVVLVGGSLTLWGLNGDVIGTKGLAISAFYAVGVLVGGRRMMSALSALTPGRAFLGGIFLIALCVYLTLGTDATLPTSYGEGRTVLSVVFGVVASSAATLAVILIAWLLGRTPVRGIVAYIGRKSLSIFLAHVVFQSGTRILLSLVGIESLATHVLLGILAGVLGPLVLAWLAHRLKCSWMFETPRWLARRVGEPR